MPNPFSSDKLQSIFHRKEMAVCEVDDYGNQSMIVGKRKGKTLKFRTEHSIKNPFHRSTSHMTTPEKDERVYAEAIDFDLFPGSSTLLASASPSYYSIASSPDYHSSDSQGLRARSAQSTEASCVRYREENFYDTPVDYRRTISDKGIVSPVGPVSTTTTNDSAEFAEPTIWRSPENQTILLQAPVSSGCEEDDVQIRVKTGGNGDNRVWIDSRIKSRDSLTAIANGLRPNSTATLVGFEEVSDKRSS